MTLFFSLSFWACLSTPTQREFRSCNPSRYTVTILELCWCSDHCRKKAFYNFLIQSQSLYGPVTFTIGSPVLQFFSLTLRSPLGAVFPIYLLKAVNSVESKKGRALMWDRKYRKGWSGEKALLSESLQNSLSLENKLLSWKTLWIYFIMIVFPFLLV